VTCDPVDEYDSRGGGFYCCVCNRWFEKGHCCVKHRKEEKCQDGSGYSSPCKD
jgi:hypothetical protein